MHEETFRGLAALRHGEREFLHWSERQAQDAGLTGTQHQLLLGIRAWPEADGPTIGAMADFLFIRHHSAVELVDRAERAGLLERRRSQHASHVHLTLTPHGIELLDRLTRIHLTEVAELAPRMRQLWASAAELASKQAQRP